MLRALQPDALVEEYADVSKAGDWLKHFDDADVVVMLQTQIGGVNYQEFVDNNVTSTKIILDKIKRLENQPYLVHISSSVVESIADDFYTQTKTEQEQIVLDSGIKIPYITAYFDV